MNLEEFFNMGGYAFYVWSSYGIALLVLLVNIIAPLRQRNKLLNKIADTARRQARRNA
ncbi:MAG: heme exporter protein CcmD [Gammaproteobacteria bacterium]|jgi:heme exporter protein D|nr:heme exporter protein CcmD [Gammaproteobacteria bacterium]MDH3887814.1 heme exporter protein CcmD [Gammaproteobacteria bacterium]MDH3935563.1 heme exporter protein CcmD [Gammaproteobacteria bacterium]MDH3987284.1 heme exporter protein CcmD [Gammaproteobacteria bacterium]